MSSRQHALGQQRRLEHAAVEQHRGRVQEAARRLRAVAEAFQLGDRAELAAEERREVARDRRVLRVRQAELRQAGARAR